MRVPVLTIASSCLLACNFVNYLEYFSYEFGKIDMCLADMVGKHE